MSDKIHWVNWPGVALPRRGSLSSPKRGASLMKAVTSPNQRPSHFCPCPQIFDTPSEFPNTKNAVKMRNPSLTTLPTELCHFRTLYTLYSQNCMDITLSLFLFYMAWSSFLSDRHVLIKHLVRLSIYSGNCHFPMQRANHGYYYRVQGCG